MVMKNIIIASDTKFSKIYNGEDANGQTYADIHSYFNYLPKPRQGFKDRYVPIINMNKCQKNKRVVMQFTFPKSCHQKVAMVMPYLGDNSIKIGRANKKQKSGDQFTWMANVINFDYSQMGKKLVNALPAAAIKVAGL